MVLCACSLRRTIDLARRSPRTLPRSHSSPLSTCLRPGFATTWNGNVIVQQRAHCSCRLACCRRASPHRLWHLDHRQVKRSAHETCKYPTTSGIKAAITRPSLFTDINDRAPLAVRLGLFFATQIAQIGLVIAETVSFRICMSRLSYGESTCSPVTLGEYSVPSIADVPPIYTRRCRVLPWYHCAKDHWM